MQDFNAKLNNVFIIKNQLSLYRFSLPFKKPIKFKQHYLASREGLWLVQHNSQGNTLIGEISPLPGFSQETLKQCEQQVLSLSQGKTIPAKQVLPSVSFALFCLNQKIPNENSAKNVSNLQEVPLLQGSPAEIVARYQALRRPALVKLKVARNTVPEEIELLNNLISINPNIVFRLDANQQWSAKQYTSFLKQINKKHIDYIEEPTLSLMDNLSISKQFDTKIALDESLLSATEVPTDLCIKALIIKPTLIGNPNKINKLLTHAQQHQLSLSISASFESPIALNQLRYLAQSWQQQTQLAVTLGLDTLQAFDTQVLSINSAELLKEATCLWTH